MAVAAYHRGVTTFTLQTPVNVSLMVEGEAAVHADITSSLKMTSIAARHISLLAFGLVKMADKTFHISHNHVGSLDDLRMACGAPELFLPFHLFNV